MTVADTPNPSPSHRHRPDLGSRPNGASPKPLPDVTDLLIMNTLDPGPARSPAQAPGANDLLNSMVEDHLQRAVPDDGADVDSAPDSPDAAAAPPPNASLSSEDSANLLKREIEMLLAGAPSDNAPKEPGNAEEPANESVVSQAELDVLVPDAATPAAEEATAVSADAAVTAESVLPKSAPSTSAAADLMQEMDEGESKMSEAEGVLAEELAQLLAETQAAENPGGTEPVVSPTAETVATAATLPADTLIQQNTAAAPVDASPAAIAATSSDAPATEARPVETAVPAVRPPGVPEHPIVELVDHSMEEPHVSTKHSGGFAGDVALMVAQLIDMPFAWMGELDKNIIGVIAALLLLGGLVFRIVAWAIGGQ